MVKISKEKLIISDVSKKRMSVSRMGDKNHFYGKKHNIITRDKMCKNHINVCGGNNPFYGKLHSEETRKHLSKLNKLKSKPHFPIISERFTDDARQRISKTLLRRFRGSLNPSYNSEKVTFQNIITKEIFCGTAYDFTLEYNLTRPNTIRLHRGKLKIYRGWKIIEKDT